MRKRHFVPLLCACVLFMTACQPVGNDEVVSTTKKPDAQETGTKKEEVYDYLLEGDELNQSYLETQLAENVFVKGYMTPLRLYESGVGEWEYKVPGVGPWSFYPAISKDTKVLNSEMTFGEFETIVTDYLHELGPQYVEEWELAKEAENWRSADGVVAMNEVGCAIRIDADSSFQGNTTYDEKLWKLYTGEDNTSFMDRGELIEKTGRRSRSLMSLTQSRKDRWRTTA